ncbi:MAG: leucine-rich repeat protein, partial [Candidatus Ventricola sp.]
IGSSAFQSCSALTSISLPEATSIGNYAFQSCSALTSISLPVATSIGSNAFYSCSKLEALILSNADAVCKLDSTNVFNYTLIASGTGYIYVPSALVDSYKNATNWSTYANQFRAIEDYPEICGTSE